MQPTFELTTFQNVSIDEPFFDNLRLNYTGFEKWFSNKLNEPVYILKDRMELVGFMYLKLENGAIDDLIPPLSHGRWLKVGTLKIIAHGTKLGERAIKKILDTAISYNADGVYVTIFSIYPELLSLFNKYGFSNRGIKKTESGIELALFRSLRSHDADANKRYPFMKASQKKAWLLAVYPAFHSRLLPDSILKNEPETVVRDVSHTNTIHKLYVGNLPLARISIGDPIIIYRTSDGRGPAYYRSVATSVCVAEEVRASSTFVDETEFITYCEPHSVFNPDELRRKFRESSRFYTLKMTYNVAFDRRVTRGRMLDEIGISPQPRWDLRSLSHQEFREVLRAGGVNERIVID